MRPIQTTWLLLSILGAPALALAFAPAPFKPHADTSGWPGWRGPQRSGVSSETGLLARWANNGPKLLWKTSSLGIGFSSPAVSRGRIYVLGMRNNNETIFALDAAANGKELWSSVIGPSSQGGSTDYPGPRSTVTVDGGHVYALGSDGDLVCLSTSGREVWRTHLVRNLEGVRGAWGYAESPLIDGELLICTPGGAKASMAALNKKTGAVVWRASVPAGNGAAYASPIVAVVGRVRQYVQLLEGCLVGVAARNGKLLWSYNGVVGRFNCATPIFRDDHIFISVLGNPGKTGSALLKLTAGKDGVTATEVYRNTDLANHFGGVVCIGDCLYGTNDEALVCVDFKTGRTKWQNNCVGKGAITAADGKLYVRGDKGSVALVAASASGYSETSRFKPPHRGAIEGRPQPVIAYGRMYLRDQESLLCFDLKKE